MRFTKEQIKVANATSIVDYCKMRGIGLEQTSADYFKGEEHDSLVVTPSKNSFIWNSRGVHGKGALSFALEYELANSNLDSKAKFAKATELVLESGASQETKVKIKREPFKFDKSQLSDKIGRAWAYLHKDRGVSSQTIDELHDKHVLEQDKHGNAIFIWRDPENTEKIVGASKQGTTIDHEKFGKRGTLKRIEKNSTTGFGFYFDSANSDGTPENIRFFESPIDAISFYDLSKVKDPKGMQNTRFVSMDGLKKAVFDNFIQKTAESLKKEGKTLKSVGLGVDNDTAGQEFAQEIQSRFSKVKYVKPNMQFGKDWNDVLKAFRHVEKDKQSTNQIPRKEANRAKRQILKKKKEQELSL